MTTTELTGGHQLTDNGVGDFDLNCPSGARRFVPYMLALLIPDGGARCPACGTLLARVDVSPLAAPRPPGDG